MVDFIVCLLEWVLNLMINIIVRGREKLFRVFWGYIKVDIESELMYGELGYVRK